MKTKLLLTILLMAGSNLQTIKADYYDELSKLETCPTCKPKLTGDIIFRSMDFPIDSVSQYGHEALIWGDTEIIEAEPSFNDIIIDPVKKIKGAAIRVGTKEKFLEKGKYWGAKRPGDLAQGLSGVKMDEFKEIVGRWKANGSRYPSLTSHLFRESKGQWYTDAKGFQYRQVNCTGLVEGIFEELGYDIVDPVREKGTTATPLYQYHVGYLHHIQN